MTKKYSHNLTNEQLVNCYYSMLLMRRFEEKSGQLYGMGLIGGFCHLYIGQEAIATGIQNAIIDGDSIITSYRDHGFMLSVGTDPKYVMAELMGKSTGCSKGKGGSMHMFNIEKHFFGGHGIVGAQVPIGTGIALANKYKKNNNVVFVCLGDGAVNQGQVYESFNMAALWKLPVIYVIENNEYAMGTSVSRSSYITDLYKKGESFGVPGHQVDGMDLFSVTQAATDAVNYCRANNGPILLEMKTYRYRGHSMSDPAKYRSKQEVEEIKEHKDPITNLKNYLISNNIISDDECNKYDKEIRNIVKESVDFSQNSSEPDAKMLYTDIYKD
ncbi:pyruvate dehydrogenase (acetyl-transferring) E1 component, alpha subunit [Ehrlichia chaffeensis str. Heartland]|uniref:Pyruvate dehydrogenase E1 component subunit alpha n=1 Tax=Ehrlichia chaffeensis (strain ATCC CRL-10679 / Arkansas) TaxID=205920 RepID=Q2GHP0_EHRCR|nr:pyruvate dehydrogenase (acetyl-transferring) E1 component subunit alpha [Ehrlichia chaffeensis]ABD44567.1 pyruvate dehydrogenase complex, E1 component, pyruvate dehydrogenase alpha subunit [Ehrlichia chaffeensis str. Arkansas]AHX03355.1 pyruvate dehydrogenase (acetyl-transferring) E1 component, alpha subunit [Ehrlichia chaffeensis str. Heartland]AHX05926.1 pyruvate dehydrogenase (acetyl-transferring) E1 component, alpha subunit [Ehrlichia chaffeensis str. Jax]AHX06916.1 pyruvate dehydrogenas